MGRFTRILLIGFALLLAACGRADINAPTATSVLFVPSKTPVEPTATVDPAKAAERGQTLFATFYDEAGFACATCHYIDSQERLVGPGLQDVRGWAQANITDQTPEEYLHTSILDPSAYIVEGFPDNLMPKIYSELFTEEEINALVAYLLTL